MTCSRRVHVVFHNVFHARSQSFHDVFTTRLEEGGRGGGSPKTECGDLTPPGGRRWCFGDRGECTGAGRWCVRERRAGECTGKGGWRVGVNGAVCLDA